MSEKLVVNTTTGSETAAAAAAAAAVATPEALDGKHGPKPMSAMQAYLVSRRHLHYDTGTSIIDNGDQRVFSYSTPTILWLQTVAVAAACGSGVALALVNLVLGNFITLLSEFSSGQDIPDNFMSLVTKQSYGLLSTSHVRTPLC